MAVRSDNIGRIKKFEIVGRVEYNDIIQMAEVA